MTCILYVPHRRGRVAVRHAPAALVSSPHIQRGASQLTDLWTSTYHTSCACRAQIYLRDPASGRSCIIRACPHARSQSCSPWTRTTPQITERRYGQRPAQARPNVGCIHKWKVGGGHTHTGAIARRASGPACGFDTAQCFTRHPLVSSRFRQISPASSWLQPSRQAPTL